MEPAFFEILVNGQYYDLKMSRGEADEVALDVLADDMSAEVEVRPIKMSEARQLVAAHEARRF